MNRVLSSSLLHVAAVVALALSACGETTDPPAGSQTHFLRACEGECGGGLSCVCGVCTEPCSGDATCAEHGASASCEAAASGACTETARICDLTCAGDDDCGELGDGFSCAGGRCREPAIDAGTAGSGSPDAGPVSGSGGSTPGGSGGSGGAGSGGAGAGGGPSTDGGTPELCSLPMDFGPCDGAFPRWYFDGASGTCMAFSWGGCEGNANRFDSQAACEAACDPGALRCSVDATDPSLPGVSVHLEGDGCAVPAGAEATFRHWIDVAEPIEYVAPDSGGACGLCGGYGDDPSNLLDVRVTRAGAQYCSCDVGCCPPTTAEPHTLMPGRYSGELSWPGREWNGPSDTGEPLGPYFPEGPADVVATLDVPGVGTIRASLSLQVLPPVFGPSDPAACLVEGKVYPHDFQNTPDPRSCNTCVCTDGNIDFCTEIGGCQESCPAGTTIATSCAQCGPADACEVLETGCLPTCVTEDDCPGLPICLDGVCRGVCG